MTRPVLYFLALLLAGCSKAPEPVTRTLQAYTSKVTVIVAPPSETQADSVVYLVRNHLQQNLESLDETFPKSDIAKINRTATTVRLPISMDTFRILDLGQYYSRLTDGFFDFTMGPVAYLWGFKQAVPPPRPPTDEALYAALERTGMDKIQLFDDNSIAITSPGARIALGPLRPAYAIDLAVVDLRRRGYPNLYLETEQVARCLGSPGTGQDWTYPVITPSERTVGVLALDAVNAPAVAWVSRQDQTLTVRGETFCSYINPHTGRPANSVDYVLVTGPTATKCAALAQAILIAGVDRASRFLSRFPGYDILVMPNREGNDLMMTSGLAERWTAEEAGLATRFMPPPSPATDEDVLIQSGTDME